MSVTLKCFKFETTLRVFAWMGWGCQGSGSSPRHGGRICDPEQLVVLKWVRVGCLSLNQQVHAMRVP